MELESLLKRLDEIDRISSQEWLARLTPRGKAELEFHNKNRDRTFQENVPQDTYEKLYGNLKYYATTHRSHRYFEEWVRKNAQGKVVLDYACGNGGMARRAAKAGAALAIGIDISDVSIANARRYAAEEGLTNAYFVQANAENTMLPDESVDTLICSGMLHHLDLSYAFPEMRRILKVGGKVLAGEALDYNPAIKLYRMLTPGMRTEWEKAHILSLKDLHFARRFFDIGEVRYWHVVGYAAAKVPLLLPLLDRLDKVLEHIPLAQLMAWMWTFEMIRPPKS